MIFGEKKAVEERAGHESLVFFMDHLLLPDPVFSVEYPADTPEMKAFLEVNDFLSFVTFNLRDRTALTCAALS